MRSIASVAALIGIVILQACAGVSQTGRGSLASDPMAEFVVPGTSLAYENARDGGTVLGKPVEAQVVRRFDLNGIRGREAVEQAGEAATGDGWVVDDERPGSHSASRTIDGRRSQLLITTADYEGEPALFIYLTTHE